MPGAAAATRRASLRRRMRPHALFLRRRTARAAETSVTRDATWDVSNTSEPRNATARQRLAMASARGGTRALELRAQRDRELVVRCEQQRTLDEVARAASLAAGERHLGERGESL